MTSSVEKLASTLDRVTRSLEGFNKAQNKTRGGVGPITTPGGKSGGIAETIIGSGDGSAVRNAAKATEQALSSTGDHIKRFVDKAITDIARLNSATKGAGQGPSYSGWTSSTGAYGGGGGGMGGGGAGPGYSEFERGIRGIEPSGGGGGGHRGGFWTGRRSVFSPTMVQDEEESASRLWGPRGFAGYAEGRGQALGRTLGLPMGGPNMLGQGAKALGGSVGLIGGVALAGAALWNYGGSSFEDVRAARIDFQQSQPFVKRGAAMAGLGLYQDQFAAIQSGSISRMTAFRKAMNDPEVMKSIYNTELDQEARDLKFHNNPQSARSWYLKGKDWIQSKAANAFQSTAEGGVSVENTVGKLVGSALSMIPGIGVLSSAASGAAGALIDTSVNGNLQKLPDADGKSILQLQQAQSFADTATEKANRLKAAANFYSMRQDPRFSMVEDRINTSSLSRLNAARMAGRRVGFDKKGNLNYEKWQADLTKGGWVEGQDIAGHQQLLQLGAGYGAGGIGPRQIAALGMAGLGNAANIVQMGGILGGSVAAGSLNSGLLGDLQHSIGKGGLDVAVGRDLFTTMAGQMLQSGGWGAGNTAASAINTAASMVGMVDANGHPTINVAQQQRMMGLYTQSDAALGDFTKGTASGIHNAMSTINAMAALGGKYSIDVENLRDMSPTQLLAIARGADVPAFYSGSDINQKSAEKFLRLSAPTGMATFADKNLVGSGPNRILMDRIRAEEAGGGSVASLIRKDTEHMSDAERNMYTMNIGSRYAGMIHRDIEKTPDQALASLLPLFQLEGLYTTKVNGKGVGVAGPSGPEGWSLKEKAEMLRQEGAVFNDKDPKEIERLFRSQVSEQNEMIQRIKGLGDSAINGDIESVSNSLITAIQAYSNWFKSHGGTGSGAPIKASPKGASSAQAKKGVPVDLQR